MQLAFSNVGIAGHMQANRKVEESVFRLSVDCARCMAGVSKLDLARRRESLRPFLSHEVRKPDLMFFLSALASFVANERNAAPFIKHAG